MSSPKIFGGENHLSQQPVPGTRTKVGQAHRLKLASRRSACPTLAMERAAPWSPIWPCTRWGLPCLLACARSGGLLLHLFTLTSLRRARRYILCGTFRQDASRRHSPRISRSPSSPAKAESSAPGYAASRPLVFGLSSPPNCSREAILRPSKIRDRIR